MNSLLFNALIILITSVSVSQFCANSFKEYGTMTDMELIFSYQIRYLMFFKYFYRYHIFEYMLFACTIFATVYLLCRRRDINTAEYIFNQKNDEDESKGLTNPKDTKST